MRFICSNVIGRSSYTHLRTTLFADNRLVNSLNVFEYLCGGKFIYQEYKSFLESREAVQDENLARGSLRHRKPTFDKKRDLCSSVIRPTHPMTDRVIFFFIFSRIKIHLKRTRELKAIPVEVS